MVLCGIFPQAAYLLPVITCLLNDNVAGCSQGEDQSPQVLIICPTRDLTLQVYRDTMKFLEGTILRTTFVCGGTRVEHQLTQLQRGCNVLVSTPGRLVNFIRKIFVKIPMCFSMCLRSCMRD